MKSTYNNKYNGINTFFSKLKNELAVCLKWSKDFIFTKKYTLFLFLMLLTGVLGCSLSSLTFSSFFENNKSITLHEISEEFKKETNNHPNCLIYYEHTITSFHETVYRNPEISREMSEVFYNNTFIDLYCSNWDGLYTPGVVQYSNGETISLSFLMFPKKDYVDQKWKYSMPLLYPTSSSPLDRLSLSTDIYINKEYANKLLIDRGFSEGDYEKLYKTEISIPFSWNYYKTSERTPDLIDMQYVIKGVINSESEEYKHYKSLFGDFFITSEDFSLPIPSETYFDIVDSSSSEKLFSNILKKYKYETKKSNNLSGISNYVFQTRISFFENNESKYKLEDIYKDGNKYTAKTDNCFETFLSSRVLYLVFWGVLNGCLFFALVFSAFNLKIKYLSLPSKKTFLFVFWILLFISVGLLIGLLSKNLIFLLIAPMKYLSGHNYWGSIIYLTEILTCLFIIALFKKKKKDNELKQLD